VPITQKVFWRRTLFERLFFRRFCIPYVLFIYLYASRRSITYDCYLSGSIPNYLLINVQIRKHDESQACELLKAGHKDVNSLTVTVDS
jgi:hypothetical protein